jgi:hypothetical protein
MRRDYVRSRILFPGLVLTALLLLLVPETHVEALRARSLSALSPLLRLFGAAGRSGEPQAALSSVPVAAMSGAEPCPLPNGRGSDGRGSDGRGSDGRGSDGRGSDGRGSDGRGSDGRGSDCRGSDGRGSDSRGSDGRGSDGPGPDNRGADPPAEDPAVGDALRAELVRLRNENALLRNALPSPPPLIEAEKDGRRLPCSLPAGLGAEVIARKIMWQEPVLALDRGEADGIKLHAGVLCRGAVAGRIISVAPHVCCMALLTHRGMSIAARLVTSRVEGVLQGSAAADRQDACPTGGERLCHMAVVGREVYVKPGELVVTSGYDGVFPPGLWLGVAVSAKKSSDVQWEIGVRPACNENAVECVHVLTCATPEAPWPEGTKVKSKK